ncbi:preprotein translocase subunit SecE [Algivirga pacifica]|uniref:Protein translocase subunit SecE n=1 Tax=Algivirga pacifica TaxID=1162670 RepID=A0ABP9DKW1_9BACT
MKIIEFLKESYAEMTEHVTWASLGELRKSSVMVLVSSAIIALIIQGVDYVFQTGIQQIYNFF